MPLKIPTLAEISSLSISLKLRNNDTSHSGSRLLNIERSCDNLREPVTTIHDEEALYPYFSKPDHIRSMKSLHDHSSASGSPRTGQRSSKLA